MIIRTRKKVLSEFFASYMLGFFGLGCVVPLTLQGGSYSMFSFSIMFGIVVALAVMIFNPVSGAHFNPSVTLSFVVFKKFPRKLLLPFWGAQLAGWTLGTLTIYLMFGHHLEAWALAAGGNPAALFYCTTDTVFSGGVIEFFATALLLIVILSGTDKRLPNRPTRAFFPFYIGLAIILIVSMTGGFTGAAINGARDLGSRIACFIYGIAMGHDVSAIFAGGFWLMYVVAPLLGGLGGTAFYECVISKLLLSALGGHE